MSVDAATVASSWPVWFTLLGTLDLTHVDAVEGPSAPNGTDTALAAFWSAFAVRVQQDTVKIPVVGSLATGTSTSTMCAIANAVAAQVPSWAWSYHAFSTSLTQVTANELSTTLGYRAIREGCSSLAGIPIYLTQAGPAPGRAWQTTDLAWLAWFDARLAEDGEVVGAALFEAGGSDRSLAPIVTQLAAFLQNPSTPDGGTPDGGTDAGQGGIASGGAFLPSGPPAKYPSSGCASAGAGAGLALLALVSPLVLRRRKRDRAGKR
jgi:Synergist-CTERM protein sorting domain-containing protein